MIDAIALGELLIDFSCNEIDSDGYPSLVSHPGGAPANWLGTIQKLGGKTELIAKVGDDVFGSLLVKTLKKAGIGTRGVSKASDVFTTLAFVTFNEKRDREFSFSRKPGADTKLGFEDIPFNLIDDSKVFHFGSLSLTDEPSKSSTRAAVDYARKHAKLISFDPNYRKPLWSSEQDAKLQMLWGLSVSDVVKISDEEVSFLFPGLSFDDAGQYIIRNYGVKLVYYDFGKLMGLNDKQASEFNKAMLAMEEISWGTLNEYYTDNYTYDLKGQKLGDVLYMNDETLALIQKLVNMFKK